MTDLTDLQRQGLQHLRNAETRGDAWVRAAFGPHATRRAQINALQSLVKRGFALQRPAPSKTKPATWRITEAGRNALESDQ